MRRERHVVEGEQRVVGGYRLAGEDVEPGAPRRPLASAANSAASSTRLPRAVLTSTAPGFIRVSASAPIMPTVSAVSGTCSETMSDSARSARQCRHSASSSASSLAARAV